MLKERFNVPGHDNYNGPRGNRFVYDKLLSPGLVMDYKQLVKRMVKRVQLQHMNSGRKHHALSGANHSTVKRSKVKTEERLLLFEKVLIIKK